MCTRLFEYKTCTISLRAIFCGDPQAYSPCGVYECEQWDIKRTTSLQLITQFKAHCLTDKWDDRAPIKRNTNERWDLHKERNQIGRLQRSTLFTVWIFTFNGLWMKSSHFRFHFQHFQRKKSTAKFDFAAARLCFPFKSIVEFIIGRLIGMA